MTIGILGATGVVGQAVLDCLRDHNLPIDDIVLMASERSAGKEMETPFGPRTVQAVSADAFADLDYCFFAAGGSTAKEWAPIANEHNCVVIDKSSAFRYDDSVPLVVPEINGEAAQNVMLIASPNCTTAIAAMVVHPLYKEFGIRKMIVSTYQSASGAGQAGLEELEKGIQCAANNQDLPATAFAHPLVTNVIPRIDAMQENGYSKEEMKLVWETRKIFGDADLQISCTCVRVPTKRAHCESIVIETEQPINPESARAVLEAAPGVVVRDHPENDVYPLPQTVSGEYDVEVGRIRQNLVFGDHGLEFFVAGDQLLRGAAWNAVAILSSLLSS